MSYQSKRIQKKTIAILCRSCRASIGQTGVTCSSGMAAAAVTRANRIARTAKFSACVPAAKFSYERARQKSCRRRLLNACCERFRQAQRGAKDFRRSPLFVVVAEIVLQVSSSPHRRDLQDRQADFV